MKGDKYKSKLLEVLDRGQNAFRNGDLLETERNLRTLAVEFSSMSSDAFAGGRSIFAVAYLNYLVLKSAYEKINEARIDL